MIILILFGLGVIAPGCHRETDQDRVEKVVMDIKKYTQEKNVRKIMSNLSKAYTDPQGFDHEAIKGLLMGYFYQHPKISVYLTNLEISIQDTSARVTLQAILSGGSKTGSATDLIPESLGMYFLDISLKKESDEWKVYSAKWERAGTDH